jgi:2-polyprenyl-3-methyl-5-hydroxy-6-metoxy-1,4-benzoquinol methylase
MNHRSPQPAIGNANITTGAPCPACGNHSFATAAYGLSRCTGCSLRVNPVSALAGEGNAINEEVFGPDFLRTETFLGNLFRDRKNARYLRNLAGFVRPPARLLEVGVGDGSLLAAARREGFEVMGCDLSPAIARHVESKYGICVHCGLLETMPAEQFDAVFLNHVVEHVEDPVHFLSTVRRLLAPNGVIHIAVPNIDCWEAALPGWNAYANYHMTYFSERTLPLVLQRAGLEARQISTHEQFSSWVLALLGTWIKRGNRTPATTPQLGNGAKGENRKSGIVASTYRSVLLAGGLITWPLRRIQSRLGRGDELIVIV